MADQEQTNTAEPTIESLQAELATERQARTGLEQLHTALQVKYDAEVADHAVTEKALIKSQSDLSEVTTVADEQNATITTLTTQIEKLQAEPAAFPTITVDKVTYEVTAKTFQYNKVEYTAAQLLKDAKLQKELVKKAVGFLVAKTA